MTHRPSAPAFALLHYPVRIVAALLSLPLAACSQQDDSDSGRSDSDVQLYRLAGTVAIGRPGAWGELCIEDDCSRANNERVYRLLGQRNRSALLIATIPNADQTE